ncbi:SbcC/MukB-like Walker B domain-containing protein [Microbacterium sp. 69-7]|uniref:ATP-binding protein n=1 Tax=Microbacterium sp. 69-7 TaxID=1895784 RepID=UPI000B1D9AAD|nr:SbcC/MukB-like Walker B domain-containing protein [Microbacterium sp. 69-7]
MTMLSFPVDRPETDPTRPGQWRLAQIEIVNWGTFAGHVAVDVARAGHLFTGASGSGKSSLLDAIAAVYTPDRWLRLNAAAQDGSSRTSDRTLMSYVRGAWSKEADETADRATTSYLRAKATWSGILLRYEDLRNEPVVLLRVFHAPGTRTEPSALKDARVFARGQVRLLDMKPHVEGGIDARRMSKAFPDALITTGGRHGRFHERVIREFGFRGDATLQLLHKTQSAKNLGTLDALFRGFMLDQPGTFARAETAVEQFTELDAAHRHVVDLRKQADALRRVDEAITAFDAASAETSAIAGLHDAVEPFTSALKLRLAKDAVAPARAGLARADSGLGDAVREQRLAAEAVESTKARVRDEGGARVELLQERIDSAQRDEEIIAQYRAQLTAELSRIGAPMPDDAEQFAEMLAAAVTEAARDIAAVSHDVRDAASQTRRALDQVTKQIQSLRDHRSNLDEKLLRARRFIAQAVGVPAAALPFAGELISVAEQHAPWRGAAERVLASLSTTLLVRDEHLAPARRAADSRALGVRLVIEAVPHAVDEPRRPKDARSLVHRLEVSDGPFGAYLRRRLATEFDYACVSHPDELEDVERGVTIGGLVKRNSRRYEKDDRHDVGDATRWVLGGDTEARLDALLARHRDATAAMERAAARDAEADARRQDALTRRDAFARVSTFTWTDIDLGSAAAVTAARRDELRTLTDASGTLREAQELAERATHRLEEANAAHARAIGENAVARQRVEAIALQIAELEAAAPEVVDEAIMDALDARFRAERRSVSLETVDEVARRVQSALSKEKDAAAARAADAEARFAGRAAEFRLGWPAASAELTADIRDRYGYRELREGILARGLPEKEAQFRKLLRERSQDVIAHLLSDLRDAPGLIRERILPVNASLGRSPFEGADRFLEIDVKTTRTPEVDEFLTDLRRIVEGNWSDESASGAEQRFDVLQRVIGRLGSKDRVDMDWRGRVLDTRLHVSFLAREKDPTGRVTRVYDSAEGLSGGQRQKLVIFCLAAALRYQLTEEEDDVPKFGSIVLDEAFDKADSRYTRNAMEVFREFGFHMILATPQKLLQTLEPYVGAITSVSNPDRKLSRLANVVFSVGGPEAPHPPHAEQHA